MQPENASRAKIIALNPFTLTKMSLKINKLAV